MGVLLSVADSVVVVSSPSVGVSSTTSLLSVGVGVALSSVAVVVVLEMFFRLRTQYWNGPL